jgi:hypothetical protein
MIHDPQDIFLADFSEPVILHTDAGDVEVLGIYDDAFFDSSIGEVVLDTTQKRLVCKMDAIGTLKREDQVTAGCQRFEVLQVQPDGTGFATILLTDVTND